MTGEIREFFLFQIGNEMLGLPMEVVEEVLTCSPITPIPGTAKFVKGLAAVRGKIMSVIDGGLRLGIPVKSDEHFVICRVRGNQTAVTIERPIEAGGLCVRRLAQSELSTRVNERKLNPRLFASAWRLYSREQEEDEWKPTDRIFLEVAPDQFVSDQMASQLMRA